MEGDGRSQQAHRNQFQGHTKFAPDWAFGLLKQKFRRTQVGCLDDLAKVVEDSAIINHAQLVGKENGEVIVPQYNWSSYFATYFRRQAFEGIKTLHHLVFSSSSPGEVLVRKESDGEVEKLKILSKAHLNWRPSPNDLPDEVLPPGMSRERRVYLFEKIREFVPEESRDKVCPSPDATPTSPAHSYGPRNRIESAMPPSSPPHPLSPAPSPKRRHVEQ